MSRVLVAGCGRVGGLLARRLVADGHEVFGLRRTAVTGVPWEPIAADLLAPGSLAALPGDLRHVAYCVAPEREAGASGVEPYVAGLRTLVDHLGRRGDPVERIVLTSSTAVHPEDAGGAVDEGSPVGGGPRSERLLAAERVVRAAPWPAVVLRLAGIYGPRRSRILDAVRSGVAWERKGPRRYGNRIHAADAAGIVRHLLAAGDPPGLLLGCDDEPCPQDVVARWLSRRLGLPAPPEGQAPPTPAAGKRCLNLRLRATGYRLRYPTFREGLEAILAASWA